MTAPKTAPDEVLRAISHDILEPLRTIRWYAEKFCKDETVAGIPESAAEAESFRRIISKSQISFQEFYDSYKAHREIAFYKKYAEEILRDYIDRLLDAFIEIKPILRDVRFATDGISVEECNRIIHRLNRRYDGLIDYLDMPDELSLKSINLCKEFYRVFEDLSAARDMYHIGAHDIKTYGHVVAEFDQLLIGLLFQNLLINSFKFQSDDSAPKITLHVWTIVKERLKPWFPRQARRRGW